VRRRRVAIQIDDAEQLLALAAKQFGDMVARTHLVVGVAREVVAEWVAGPTQNVQGPLGEGTVGDGGGGHD